MKFDTSGRLAPKALAVIGPMPEMVCSRTATAAFCAPAVMSAVMPAVMSAVICAIRPWVLRNGPARSRID